MNDKQTILRDLEYVIGGITALKTMYKAQDEKKFTPFYELCDEWQDILCSVIDLVEEDSNNDATYS